MFIRLLMISWNKIKFNLLGLLGMLLSFFFVENFESRIVPTVQKHAVHTLCCFLTYWLSIGTITQYLNNCMSFLIFHTHNHNLIQIKADKINKKIQLTLVLGSNKQVQVVKPKQIPS